jgi:uncharacterized Zn finger protein
MPKSMRMKRISMECLTCGHRSSIPEERLKAFRLSPDASIASFIRRLTCSECGATASELTATTFKTLADVRFTPESGHLMSCRNVH